MSMNVKRRRYSSVFSTMAVLLGLLCASNIVSFFKVGNTEILLVYMLSIVINIYFVCIDNRFVVINITKILNTPFRFFMMGIVLSIIPAILFSSETLSRWLVGVIHFLLVLSVMLSYYYLRFQTKDIIKGIGIGVLMNAVTILFEYYQYLNGHIFRLSELFASFSMRGAYIGNAFRGVGWFKEPGHLARFLSLAVILLFSYYYNRNKKLSWFYVIVGTLMMATTRSATTVIYFAGFVMTIMLINGKHLSKSFVACFILVVISGFIFMEFNINLVSKVFSGAFEDVTNIINLADSSSISRFSGMQSALQIIIKHPLFGVGWNEFTSHFIADGYYSEQIRGSYSGLLTYYGNIGLFSIGYLWSFVSLSIENYRKGTPFGIALSVIALQYVVCFTIMDYSFDCFIALLLGLLLLYPSELSSDTHQA